MGYLSQHPDIVQALIEQAHKFYRLQYQMSNGGNLSARLPGTDIMVVKGTDVAFSEVSTDTLSVTDLAGVLVEGSVRPSKEALLHGAIYQAFPQVMAIMHCHSPWATAWAAKHDQLALSTHHASLKLGGFCPVFDTQSYAVPEAYFPRILETFQAHPGMNSFLLRGHGQVTVGPSMRDAAMLAELVEETAQIALLAQ